MRAGRELAFVAFVPLAKGCIRAALQIESNFPSVERLNFTLPHVGILV